MNSLPVANILPDLCRALNERDEAVLEAPPGAGKTTLVPLALLDEPFLQGQRIVVLEPRRLAARAAAERMAQLHGDAVGQTVGYRVRLDSRVSAATRIEVITEGILTRMLQDDPSLEGVGLLIFDEFHERSLDADLGLALALEGRRLFADLRPQPLKILLMSATLDGQRAAELLDDAPVLRSEGRQYPVEIHYLPQAQPGEFKLTDTVAVIQRALQQHAGNLLVFLPGQGEIHRCQAALAPTLASSVHIAPLYGNLSLDKQRVAISPPPPGQRKIVLATPIAESSLTIEGITVVIDSGLLRQPAFDPRSGMSRLALRRVSKASAQQRAGRAGRLQAGVCYRLWSQAQQGELAPYGDPEILQADLSGLVMQLLRWGVGEVDNLKWLDSPPPGAYAQGLGILRLLGAVNDAATPNLTAHGQAMAQLPVHPRLGHLLIRGWQLGAAELACDLAAMLGERDFLPGRGSDVALRLAALRGEYRLAGSEQGAVTRWRRQQQQLARALKQLALPAAAARQAQVAPGELLAMAYPDRIARQRPGRIGEYLLSNGRSATLSPDDPLQGQPWLVAAELGGRQDATEERIYLAATLDEAAFEEALADYCQEQTVAEWDTDRERFVAQRRWRVGAITLRTEALPDLPAADKEAALLNMIGQRGLQLLNWTDAARQFCGRVNLLRQLDCPPGQWPDLGEAALLASMGEWLAPFLGPVRSLRDLQQLAILPMLQGQLDWPQRLALERLAPETLQVPSASRLKIDYCQSPPVLAVKLQEMFGCEQTPTVAGGRQTLMLHLLSPARRPLQITQDLAGFWQGSYREVKKEMKNHYPKHPWPDDPLSAPATAKTRRAGGGPV